MSNWEFWLKKAYLRVFDEKVFICLHYVWFHHFCNLSTLLLITLALGTLDLFHYYFDPLKILRQFYGNLRMNVKEERLWEVTPHALLAGCAAGGWLTLGGSTDPELLSFCPVEGGRILGAGLMWGLYYICRWDPMVLCPFPLWTREFCKLGVYWARKWST